MKQPEEAAFTAHYEQYAPRVFTYFQYRCDDPAIAQDLTMQVFERAWSALPRYDAHRAPFAAWLFAIARHVAADWQRQQYVHQVLPWDRFAPRSSRDPGPEQISVKSDERRQLREALQQLSPRERDLIGLRFASGLTNRAIAEMTGLSESNVAVILYRALRKLRQALSDNLADEMERPCPKAKPLTEVEHD